MFLSQNSKSSYYDIKNIKYKLFILLVIVLFIIGQRYSLFLIGYCLLFLFLILFIIAVIFKSFVLISYL